jgi:hypothetical protein
VWPGRPSARHRPPATTSGCDSLWREDLATGVSKPLGIDANGAAFLALAYASGADFTRTCMVGRQGLFLSPKDLLSSFASVGVALDPNAVTGAFSLQERFAEPFFKMLGAQEIASLDASDFEGATVIHDMNQPVPPSLDRRFSAVFDGGSLEHVFNYPVAVTNAMRMVELGGHFIAVTPANNEMGHGFYQFSPELIFRVFSDTNGYELERLLIAENRKEVTWYEVSDPAVLGARGVLVNCHVTYLYLQARRVSDVPLFKHWPQQSDYAVAWSGGPTPAKRDNVHAFVPLRRLVERLAPPGVWDWAGSRPGGSMARLPLRRLVKKLAPPRVWDWASVVRNRWRPSDKRAFRPVRLRDLAGR